MSEYRDLAVVIMAVGIPLTLLVYVTWRLFQKLERRAILKKAEANRPGYTQDDEQAIDNAVREAPRRLIPADRKMAGSVQIPKEIPENTGKKVEIQKPKSSLDEKDPLGIALADRNFLVNNFLPQDQLDRTLGEWALDIIDTFAHSARRLIPIRDEPYFLDVLAAYDQILRAKQDRLWRLIAIAEDAGRRVKAAGSKWEERRLSLTRHFRVDIQTLKAPTPTASFRRESASSAPSQASNVSVTEE